MKIEKIEKNIKKQVYEIRYGTPHQFKVVHTDDHEQGLRIVVHTDDHEQGLRIVVHTDDYEQGLRIYDKAKRFSEKHGLTWIIALWYNGWLEKSETINGEIVTYEELLNR